jgi:lipopolysaccharide/colanic/teichoic acid biosynthesis glycosyltransferase
VTVAGRRIEWRRPASRERHLVWQGRQIPVAGSDRPLVHWMKRALDVSLASFILIVLAPFLLAVAAAIRLTSPGPALFVQERYGSRRRRPADGVEWEPCTFRCFKFRTMVVEADPSVHAKYVRDFIAGDLPPTDHSVAFKIGTDPRVTSVGRLLRRTSLDELPQLLNVIRGDMSLVGPRPVPIYEVLSYPGDWCLERLGARPGLTGAWQVHGRGTVRFEEMIQMDLDYVRRPSLVRDLRLLCLTLPCVISRRGAR